MKEKSKKTNLGTLLEGKRVVVVGRAHYLLNNPFLEDQANFIDGHDIVVRINTPSPTSCRHFISGNEEGCFIDPNWVDVLGKKTDVLHVNRNSYLGIPNVLDVFVNAGGKAITNVPMRKLEQYSFISRLITGIDCIHSEVLSRIEQYLSDDMFLAAGMKTSLNKHREEITRRTTVTGSHIAIWNILAYDVQEVSMIGFTQWQTKHPEDVSSYDKLVKFHPHRSPDHGLFMFRMKMEQDSRLKPDAMLQMILDKRKAVLDEIEDVYLERKEQWYDV